MSYRPTAAVIARDLQVPTTFDAGIELERRTAFIEATLKAAGRTTLVLGISGGVDSLTAGCLAQLTVERMRSCGNSARFVAMRLPYGEQRDEHDAAEAIRFIAPDEVIRVDIEPMVAATMRPLHETSSWPRDDGLLDFVRGNVKARQRMVAQYAVANALGGLVIGTDHAAEAVMGFFTKHGDGACDLAPL
jgi:NAD+ synthase